MKRFVLCLAAGVLLALAGRADKAEAGCWAARFAAITPWHAGYYHTAWGTPVALVVPPHVKMHREMGWGVCQTSMLPIYHQYGRSYPGQYDFSDVQLLPTPRWPSHTDQFGVYYVRGPW
jgi:hypothetical protein